MADEDEVAEGEGAKPWKLNPSYRTRANSPTRLPSTSLVWAKVRRLEYNHPKVADGYTHVCIEVGCGAFMKLVKAKDSSCWPTTRAGEHLKNAHPESCGKPAVIRAAVAQVFPSLSVKILLL